MQEAYYKNLLPILSYITNLVKHNSVSDSIINKLLHKIIVLAINSIAVLAVVSLLPILFFGNIKAALRAQLDIQKYPQHLAGKLRDLAASRQDRPLHAYQQTVMHLQDGQAHQYFYLQVNH